MDNDGKKVTLFMVMIMMMRMIALGEWEEMLSHAHSQSL